MACSVHFNPCTLGLDRKHLYVAFMCCLTFIHSTHLCAQLLGEKFSLVILHPIKPSERTSGNYSYCSRVYIKRINDMMVITFVNKFVEGKATA